MANISIGGQLSLALKAASLDLRYGPYSSIAEAYDSMGPSGDDVITAGLPFGIIESDDSVSVYIWTKTNDATENDCKKLNKEYVVLFNGFIDVAVSVKQQSFNDVATRDNIVFLTDRKQFAYRDGLTFYLNWKNRYKWSAENFVPYDNVIYIDMNTDKSYYFDGVTLKPIGSGITDITVIPYIEGTETSTVDVPSIKGVIDYVSNQEVTAQALTNEEIETILTN